MCYRKIQVRGNFSQAKDILEGGGYRVPLEPFDEGVLLLWRGKDKRVTRKGPRITATCRKVTLRDLKRLLKGRRKTAKQCKNGVYRISPDGEVRHFKTVRLAAEELGVRPMNIYKCANQYCNELKSAYGYKWTYKDPKGSKFPKDPE